ncbi:MAG: LysR family transcriptional regulator [Alphaproteobacteria bacterium]|nr:LysR family transcriptional regulator [Alphaproteobacteria bacterium]
MRLDPLPWDELKLLLAAGRTSSLKSLAHEMGIDPTTASRRMKTLEETVGLSLFIRSHGALRLTDEGNRLLRHAQSMERAEQDFRISVQKLKNLPKGVVRISAPPTIARFVLGPAINRLRRTAPDISIDLETETGNVRLERWEADIAVRLGAPRDVTDTLLVSRIGTAAYAVFEPANGPRPAGWIAYPRRFSHVPEAAWVEDRLAGTEPVMRANDPMAMAMAVAAGAGRAVLPVALGPAVPGIVQPAPPVLEREVWALRHAETGKTSAVRTAYEWLVETFRPPPGLVSRHETSPRRLPA